MSALDPGWSSTEIASKVATSAESERPPSGQGHIAYGDGMDNKAHHLMTGRDAVDSAVKEIVD
jgi:hypothetical protein